MEVILALVVIWAIIIVFRLRQSDKEKEFMGKIEGKNYKEFKIENENIKKTKNKIIPEQRAVTIDTEEDLPLFIQEPPQVVIFKTTEERELWDAASEEEKENLVKPYTFKDQVSKHFKD